MKHIAARKARYIENYKLIGAHLLLSLDVLRFYNSYNTVGCREIESNENWGTVIALGSQY